MINKGLRNIGNNLFLSDGENKTSWILKWYLCHFQRFLFALKWDFSAQ